jgi:O-antigen/teichoic acid export membrane protein
MMPWIVTAVRGEAVAGVLAACVSLVGVASMFMTGVATYLTPKAARAYASGGVGELRHVLRMANLTYAVALGAFTLFVFATGDFLLVSVFGDKYAGYGAVMGILALSMTAISMGLTASTGIWAIDRPAANLPADVCSLVVTLTIVFFLVGPLGIYGAALADLGGNVSSSLVRYATLRRLLNAAQPSTEGR